MLCQKVLLLQTKQEHRKEGYKIQPLTPIHHHAHFELRSRAIIRLEIARH